MNDQRVLEVEQKSPVSEEDNLIIDTVNKFLERDVKPFVKEFESEDKYPQLIADKMADLGLFGATISHNTEAWVYRQLLILKLWKMSLQCGCLYQVFLILI